jgi:hypothetical protein
MMKPFTREVAEAKFWARVDKTDGCWLWMAYLKENGYGMATYGGKALSAHRVAWFYTHGEVPRELDICHHCDNRRCVRPDHLFVGTRKDNMQDAKRKGRTRNWGMVATRCKYGHPFSHTDRFGRRRCVICQRRQALETRARRAPSCTTANAG